MAHKMQYRIVYGETLGELETGVANLLEQGWAPTGGVAAIPICPPTERREQRMLVAQAMVHA